MIVGMICRIIGCNGPKPDFTRLPHSTPMHLVGHSFDDGVAESVRVSPRLFCYSRGQYMLSSSSPAALTTCCTTSICSSSKSFGALLMNPLALRTGCPLYRPYWTSCPYWHWSATTRFTPGQVMSSTMHDSSPETADLGLPCEKKHPPCNYSQYICAMNCRWTIAFSFLRRTISGSRFLSFKRRQLHHLVCIGDLITNSGL